MHLRLAARLVRPIIGDFDPWVVNTIRRLAKPGSVGLDIGANIGAVALKAAF